MLARASAAAPPSESDKLMERCMPDRNFRQYADGVLVVHESGFAFTSAYDSAITGTQAISKPANCGRWCQVLKADLGGIGEIQEIKAPFDCRGLAE